MHISFPLAVTVLLAPVLGSLYPRDAYERLYARRAHYAELEAHQAYRKTLAREAYVHPDLYGYGLDFQPRRAHGTPSRVPARKHLRTRMLPPPAKAGDIPLHKNPFGSRPAPRLRARMPVPPVSTLASLPEGLREGGASQSDSSSSRPGSRVTSPFTQKEPVLAFARVAGTRGGSISEIEPAPDQHGHSGDTHPDRQPSGGLRSSGSGDAPRLSSLKTSSNSRVGRPELSGVSFEEEIGLRRSASSPALRRMGSKGLLGALAGAVIHGAEDLVRSASGKRKRPSGASPSVSRAGSLKEGGGSPTASKASKSTLHSADTSPGSQPAGQEGNHPPVMGDRPRSEYAADAGRRTQNRPSNAPGSPRGSPRGSARGSAFPSHNGNRNGRKLPPSRQRGVPAGTAAKKAKHPHLERPPKKLYSTKPWNALGLGVTAIGAGGGGIWAAKESQRGADAAVLSSQASVQIANASMISAEAGVRGANAAALSAQAGMKGSDAAQLSAEAGMKSANAAMISAQQSIKSANGTQLIGAVQLATAANNPNITDLAGIVGDVRGGRIEQASQPVPGGGAGAVFAPLPKGKRSYPPVVLYYDR